MLQGLTEIAARHGMRLPASLALAGKAFAQMQLAAAELDPALDPVSVAGRFLIAERVRSVCATGSTRNARSTTRRSSRFG